MSGYFEGVIIDSKSKKQKDDFTYGIGQFRTSFDDIKDKFDKLTKDDLIVIVVDSDKDHYMHKDWSFGIPKFIEKVENKVGFKPKYEVIEWDENDETLTDTLDKYVADKYLNFSLNELTKRLQSINFADMPDPGTIVRYKNGKWLSLDDKEKPVLTNYPDEFVKEEYAREAAKKYDPNMRNWSFETATRYFSYKRNNK